MSGKLTNKLKSKKGETITETLVSVLIAAAAMILFASMITSSQRILQKSESIMDAYYDGEAKMEAMIATTATTGNSTSGIAMVAGGTEGVGEARTGGTEGADEVRTGGETGTGKVKTGSGTVTIKAANEALPYGISNKHKGGEISVSYATNQPGDASTGTSGIERFAVAEYKSQN